MTSNEAEQKLEILRPDAAGIDCGAQEHYVAVPVDRVSAGQPTVRCFSAFTEGLDAAVFPKFLGRSILRGARVNPHANFLTSSPFYAQPRPRFMRNPVRTRSRSATPVAQLNPAMREEKRFRTPPPALPPASRLVSTLCVCTVGRKKHVKVGTKRISLEQLRKVLGLESVKDADGKIIQEAPLPVWANFRQRALDTAIAEINKKTDLNIALESLERSAHRRVTTLTFAIKTQAIPNGNRDN